MQGLGGVALEGGGTDVDQAFQWMIGQMGGKGDFLVLRATKDAKYDSYIYKFGGANSVATLDIPSLAAAQDPAVAQIIQNADAIFIAGGAQNDYLNFWKGTPVQAAIVADVARGVPIGGTSAGTDVIGQFIYSALNNSVTSAAALANPFNSDMTFDENFISSPPSHSAAAVLPFLNNTLVDTHFITRDRTGRMIAFLARVDANGWSPNDQPMGIGINEQTALLINADGSQQELYDFQASQLERVNVAEAPGVPATATVLGSGLNSDGGEAGCLDLDFRIPP
jgi:cyanophycinase